MVGGVHGRWACVGGMCGRGCDGRGGIHGMGDVCMAGGMHGRGVCSGGVWQRGVCGGRHT